MLPRPSVCYIYLSKAGVQGFKILYWLSSCDDKDKDKDGQTQTQTQTQSEYFSGVNISQGEYFEFRTIYLVLDKFRRWGGFGKFLVLFVGDMMEKDV